MAGEPPEPAKLPRPATCGAAQTAALRAHPTTLDRLGETTRRHLKAIASTRRWRAGEVLLRAGAMAPFMFTCDEGRLRIYRLSLDGSERLSRWIAPGELVGIVSVVGRQPSHITITAEGPCRTTNFDADRLRQLMMTEAEVALDFARMLAQRVQELSDVSIEEQHERLDLRLYATLVRLSRMQANSERRGDGLELRISQSDLAGMVSSSRQYVNPMLKRLQAQGLVRLGYRTILLLDGHEERAAILYPGFP